MHLPTAEQLLLADAILRHRPFSLQRSLCLALQATGEYVPEEEQALLQEYVDAINIDMVADGYRYVSRGTIPLLGLGPLELFEEEGVTQLLTRCAVWYGDDALSEWRRRGGS